MSRHHLHRRFVDMSAAMKLGPPVYRCGAIAADGHVTTIAGIRGDNKSWLAMLLSAGVESGDEVAGFRCRKGVTLYIDGENGPRVMGHRFELLNLDPDAFIIADGNGLHLPRDMNVVRDMVTVAGANLLVLDALRRLSPGADENSSNDMAPIYAALARMAQELDIAVIVIHHRSPKMHSPDSRGSSAIEDQTDLFYVLERAPNDPERKTRRRLRNTKNRIDAEQSPVWLQFKKLAGFMTVERAEPFAPEPEATVPENLADSLHELAERVREDGGWPPRRLAEAVGRDPQNGSFKDALGRLVIDHGWTTQGKARARVYVPPELGESGGTPRDGPSSPNSPEPLFEPENDAVEPNPDEEE